MQEIADWLDKLGLGRGLAMARIALGEPASASEPPNSHPMMLSSSFGLLNTASRSGRPVPLRSWRRRRRISAPAARTATSNFE